MKIKTLKQINHMNFKKLFLAVYLLAIFGFLFNFGASNVNAMTITELQTLIAKIQSQVVELQRQLVEVKVKVKVKVEKEEILSPLTEKSSPAVSVKKSTLKDLIEKKRQGEEVSFFLGDYAPDEIIVKFKSNAISIPPEKQKVLSSEATIASFSIVNLNQKFGLKEIERVFNVPLKKDKYGQTIESMSTDEAVEFVKQKFPQRTSRAPKKVKVPDISNIYKFTFPKGANITEMILEYKKDPNVEYAEPNYIYRTFALSNDTYVDPDQDGKWESGTWGQSYEDMWSLKKIQMENVWDMGIEKGTSAVVAAVVDTGIDYNHEDLADNIWINPGEISGNNIDDDNNGYIDDFRGWNFFKSDNNIADGHGHGTHVAGTIAGITNNAKGVAGISQYSRIMGVRGFSDEGEGYTDDLAAAIQYAADNGADVINMSFGGPGDSLTWNIALDYAYSLGCVLVAAAGNENDDALNYSPARHPGVITVSAFDYQDKKASWSNYGIKIDVAAPGVDILSLRAAGTDMYGDGKKIVGERYYRSNGTSMAAPHVVGLAALILSKNPEFNNEQVRQVIRKSADDVDIPGWDINSGYGRINAYGALQINIPPSVSHISSAAFIRTAAPLLTINGSAYGDKFLNYKIEYGFGSAPEQWEPVTTSKTPVTKGVLAVLDASNFEEGFYSIKLSVSEIDNEAIEDRVSVYYSPNFVLKWGEFGLKDGQFTFPSFVTVDRDGYIYVSSDLFGFFGLKRIQKFDGNGNFVAEWDMGGWAMGIAVDNEGYIWVVDTWEPAVKKYSSNGEFQMQFGSAGLGDGQFYSPIGIAIDKKGNIYVVEDYVRSIDDDNLLVQQAVHKFTKNGIFVKRWGTFGTVYMWSKWGAGDGEFRNPIDITVNGDYLYVTDSQNHRVQKFTLDGEFVKKWGDKGDTDGKFNEPSGIDVDGNGQIYIMDSGNSRVQVFDTEGNFVTKWGSRGINDGQFMGRMMNCSAWNGIYVDKHNYAPTKYVYVSDMFSSRIQKFRAHNQAPILDFIGNKEIEKDKLLKFTVTASDPNNDILAYSVNNLPSGAKFFHIIQKENKVFYGDVNLDGNITADDSTLLASYMIGKSGLTEAQKIVAEVNGDGKITLADAAFIGQYVSGKINKFPVNNFYGDVNLDGNITADDSTLLASYVIGKSDLTEAQKIVAEVNGDGKITLADAAFIGQYVSGKINKFSVNEKLFFIWTPNSNQIGYHIVNFKVTDGILSDFKDITIEVIGPLVEKPVEDVSIEIKKPAENKQLIGDVNNDGVVSVADSSFLSKSLAGTEGFPSSETIKTYCSADVNHDGVVNDDDATFIAKHVIGKSGYCVISGIGTCAKPNYPGAQEICNDGIDNDCDGAIDETECKLGLIAIENQLASISEIIPQIMERIRELMGKK